MKTIKHLLTLFFLFITVIVNSQAVYNGSTKHIFTTNGGTIEVGPFNTSWAHIYTDRSKFIFNKDVYTVTNAFSSYNNDLILKTEGTERLRINDISGNVGIGSSNPQSPLHIASSYDAIQTFQTSDDSWLYTNWMSSNGTRRAYMGLNISLTEFRINVENGTNKIILNGGNVGIGTTTPAEKLDVTGNIAANTILLRDPINTSDWNTIWQSGFYQSYNATNAPESDQWFWGVNLNHSSNSSTYRYNGQIAIKNSSTNPTMYFRSTNVDGIGTWARLVHSEGNQFINGNLGIGTTSPGAWRLAVKGKIRAEEIKVETGWADYVFNENYDLPTLKEVEKHIKEKGHLINIPSAKEVEANGIQLGEMNKLLLEKIEELTLYTLQQQKELKEQNDRIISLEKKLAKL